MNGNDKTTLSRIHDAARSEFLQKGFREASLRNIVKTAGVTTGAFYGYYNNKEELFAALVDEPYRHLIDEYRSTLEYFAALPPEEQPEQMGKVSGGEMHTMLRYMHEHSDAFHLILQCSDGTGYANLIDTLVQLETESTHKYCDVLNSLGRTVPHIDARLEHILVTGLMNAYFEIIIHDMPTDDAERYLDELNAFYTAGWNKIMGQ